MIVQSSADGWRSLVIDQLEHTRLAGRFATAWGNDAFAPLSPGRLMEFVTAHHDQGWEEVDAHIGRDPDTGLPYNLVRTPLAEVMKTGARGPDFNERHHPFCGLLSSMHSYGLYTGRYGMSDKVFVDMVPPAQRPALDDLLASERARQDRLRAVLAADPATAAWVTEAALFHNYKLLQFFDTLALYFNCTHEAARGTSAFANVPRALGDDVTIAVSRVACGVYRFDPYPWCEDELEMTCAGRWLAPQPAGTDMQAALDRAPAQLETMRFIA